MIQMTKKYKECSDCGKRMWFAESEEVWYCEDSDECGYYEEMDLQEQLNKLLMEKAALDEEIAELTKQLENEND
jgi:ribosomal protein S27AE